MNPRLVEVGGSYYETGRQIGVACQTEIEMLVDYTKANIPEEKNWGQILNECEPFAQASRVYYHHIAEQIQGAADGAGIDVRELWATVEEQDEVGCTDIVVVPPATDGNVLIGHTNDFDPATLEMMTMVLAHIDNGLSTHTVGLGGIFVSIGANSRGVVLSGDNVTSNDVRRRDKVPRSIIAMAILHAVNGEDAARIALDEHRASSYNNIIGYRGTVVAYEGSATACAIARPNKKGRYHHANSYTHPDMLIYEGKPNYTSSIERNTRAGQLIKDLEPIDRNKMIAILRDHGTSGIPSDNTICRHNKDRTTEAETLFATVIDMTAGTIDACFGFPCESEFKEIYRFPTDAT